jgi:tetratricopeptide (TPR) repeat protein/HEAT repeat protein
MFLSRSPHRTDLQRLVFTLLWICLLGLLAIQNPHSYATPTSDPSSDLEANRRLASTYRAMLAEDPYQEYALRRLLEVSHAVGGLVGLIVTYEEQLKTAPDSLVKWVVLGHLHHASGHDAEAIAAYEQAIRCAPKRHENHLAVARLHRLARLWGKALASYDASLNLVSHRDRKQTLLKEMAEVALKAKDAERAENYFKTLLATAPKNIFLWMEKGAMLNRFAQHERSLSVWNEVRRMAKGQLKHLVVAWKQIAELQERLGQWEPAEATVREALTQLPAKHWSRPAFFDSLVGIYRRNDALHELASELEKQRKPSTETKMMLAQLYEELGKDENALDIYVSLSRRRPKDLEPRLRTVEILKRLGRLNAVLKAYRAIVKAEPDEPQYLMKLAELSFQQGLRGDAFKILSRLSKRFRHDPSVHQGIIDQTMRYGDPNDVHRIEREYNILIRIAPQESGHVISLGEFYWSQEKRLDAQDVWRKLKTYGNSAGEGHFILAEVLADHALTDEAEKHFREALSLEPNNWRFVRAYALWLEKRGKLVKAMRYWKHVLKGNESSSRGRYTGRPSSASEARRRIVGLWEHTGQLDKEEGLLEKRFASQPPDLDAGHFLAEIYLQKRRLLKAERILERLRRLEPNRRTTLEGLEELYTRQNRLNEATDILLELARLNPRAAYEYYHRATDLALAMRNDLLALEYTQKVVSLNPADPSAHIRVGELFSRLGRQREATEALRQALALHPRNDKVRFRLAAFYRELGETTREEQLLQEIIRESANAADILQAGRRLLQTSPNIERLMAIESLLLPLVVHGGYRREAHLKLLIDVYMSSVKAFRWTITDEQTRISSLKELGDRALKPLVMGLMSKDVALRSRSLEIARWTLPSGLVPVLARILSESDSMAVVSAAIALGEIGSAAAVDSLERLVDHERPDEQQIAVWALGLAKNPAATQVLIQVVEHGNPRLRFLATFALGFRGSKLALQTLHGLMGHVDARLRIAVVWAVAHIADPSSQSMLDSVTRTRTALEAELAVWGLGRIANPGSYRALSKHLWRADSIPPGLLASALLASHSDTDHGSFDNIYRAMLDKDKGRIRADTSMLFGQSRPEQPTAQQRLEGTRRLLPLLSERIGTIFATGRREHLNRFLTSLLGPKDLLQLLPLLSTREDDEEVTGLVVALLAPHTSVLYAAGQGLLGATSQSLALTLLSHLVDSGHGLPDEKALRRLALRAFDSPSLDVRLAALKVLARIEINNDDEAALRITEIFQSITRDDGRLGTLLKAHGAHALGTHGGPVIIEPLRVLLADPHTEVKRAAVLALKGQEDISLVGILEDLLDDHADDVAEAALEVLAGMSLPEAKEIVSRIKRSENARLIYRLRALERAPQ